MVVVDDGSDNPLGSRAMACSGSPLETRYAGWDLASHTTASSLIGASRGKLKPDAVIGAKATGIWR